jgi:serine/threonine protein kinase
MSSYPWFQAQFDRHTAEAFLRDNANAHTFVVRESSKAGQLSLSIRQKDDTIAHSIIERTPQSLFLVRRANETITADSLPALLTKLSLDINEPYAPAAAADALYLDTVPTPDQISQTVQRRSAPHGLLPTPSNAYVEAGQVFDMPAQRFAQFTQPQPLPSLPQSAEAFPAQRFAHAQFTQPQPLPSPHSSASSFGPMPRSPREHVEQVPYAALPVRAQQLLDVHKIDAMSVAVRTDARGVMVPLKDSPAATLYKGRWTYDRASSGVVAPWLEAAGAPTVSVAVKLVRKPTSSKALAAWSRLAHANVLPLFGVIVSPEQRQVMPFANGGTLRELLDSPASAELADSELFQLSVLRDVASALVYLHSQNVLHRDLRACNVMLHRFGGGGASVPTALLGGFSLTREVAEAEDQIYTTADFNVPLQPLAPEQLTDYMNGLPGCRSSHETDVWAFGVLCCEVLLPEVANFYSPLFEDLAQTDLRGWMERVYHFVTERAFTPLDMNDLSEATPSLLAVAKRCLQHMPAYRPPIDDIHNALRSLADTAARAARVQSNPAKPPHSAPAPASLGVPSVAASRRSRDAEPPAAAAAAASPASPRAVVPKEIYGRSDQAIGQREFLEAEREFSYRMTQLDAGYRQSCFASVMTDRPVLPMADIDAIFQNVQALAKAADTFYQAVVKASAGDKFFASAAASLKSSKIADSLSKFLGGVAASQQVLYARLYGGGSKRDSEAFAQLLDGVQRGKRANGASLSELLAAPYQHMSNQKRLLARLAGQVTDAGEKEALGVLRAALDGIKSDNKAGDMDAKAVAQSLKWSSKMLVNDFGSLSLLDGEHKLVRIGTFGVKLAGAKKAKSHNAYLFHDALLLCEKKKVVAALDLGRAIEIEVRVTSPAAFSFTSRNLLSNTTFKCECTCTAMCDAQNWVNDIDGAHAALQRVRKQ